LHIDRQSLFGANLKWRAFKMAKGKKLAPAKKLESKKTLKTPVDRI